MLVTVLKIEPQVDQDRSPTPPRSCATRSRSTAPRRRSQDLHDKIEDDRAGGSTLEAGGAEGEAASSSLTTSTAPAAIRTASSIANLRTPPDIVSAAFASDVGVDNDPIDVDGGYVWYDVAAITPARDRTLDEVKEQVTQRWRDDQIASRLKTKAADLLDKLKNGTPFDTLAAAEKLEGRNRERPQARRLERRRFARI